MAQLRYRRGWGRGRGSGSNWRPCIMFLLIYKWPHFFETVKMCWCAFVDQKQILSPNLSRLPNHYSFGILSTKSGCQQRLNFMKLFAIKRARFPGRECFSPHHRSMTFFDRGFGPPGSRAFNTQQNTIAFSGKQRYSIRQNLGTLRPNVDAQSKSFIFSYKCSIKGNV